MPFAAAIELLADDQRTSCAVESPTNASDCASPGSGRSVSASNTATVTEPPPAGAMALMKRNEPRVKTSGTVTSFAVSQPCAPAHGETLAKPSLRSAAIPVVALPLAWQRGGSGSMPAQLPERAVI